MKIETPVNFKKHLCSNVLVFVVSFALMLTLAACSGGNAQQNNTQPSNANSTQTSNALGERGATFTTTINKDSKFEAANLSATEDDLKDAGFELGDSVSVEFSNGEVLEDIPYYDGYYVRRNEPLMVAYPGAACVTVTKNNGNYWSEAHLANGDSVTITLNEKGKYLDTQESLNLSYSMNREDYSSDAEFANFRALSGGTLKENYLYRGASPFDSAKHRATTVNSLLESMSILNIVDLADSDSDIEKYSSDKNFKSDYALNSVKTGHAILVSMTSDYETQSNKEKTANALRFISSQQDCAYIHCQEGKDRTGFVCMLIEALCGATYDEMCADYMETYKNYYGITKEDMPERYSAVVELYFDAFCEYLLSGQYSGSGDAVSSVEYSGDILKNAQYKDCAIAYLEAGGMTQEEIDALVLSIQE